jgi:DNA repair protein RadA/Sms
MAKPKTSYVCSNCGHSQGTWKGQCPECEQWNVLEETMAVNSSVPGRGGRQNWAGKANAKAQLLDKVGADKGQARFTSGISEFDRALGGGLVVGSVVLLGGDPGIGKSTLLLQATALAEVEHRLYITGEESAEQIASRAKRLGLSTRGAKVLPETSLEIILESAADIAREGDGRGLLVIDSIQTLYSEAIPSAPGTVTQVRECAAQLTRLAKQTGLTIVLIGHVTKDGSLAGPRVLEHMVDTVLYFEGDPQSPHRLVRAFKNRFGAAQELGAFEMTELGLISIDNPSAMFLAADRGNAAGSCVFVMQDGPRPLLVEIQALMDTAAGSNPKRLAVGVDLNRLSMILAILHKKGGIDVLDQDVFANAVGGLKVTDTAVDLPLVMALVSSLSNKAMPADMACFGEMGLTGEVRPVQRGEERLREAHRLGFTKAIVPLRCVPKKPLAGMEVVGVRSLAEALAAASDWK